MKHLKHLKHRLATCSFSATYPCCLRMKARWHVEFISVELAGGAELAAPVEKAMAGPMEKAAAGPCAGEAHSRREARWRGRSGGEGSEVESAVAEAARSRRCGELSWFLLELLGTNG